MDELPRLPTVGEGASDVGAADAVLPEAREGGAHEVRSDAVLPEGATDVHLVEDVLPVQGLGTDPTVDLLRVLRVAGDASPAPSSRAKEGGAIGEAQGGGRARRGSKASAWFHHESSIKCSSASAAARMMRGH